MDSVLPALLAVSVMLLATLMVGQHGFDSFNLLSDSWRDAEERSIERIQTDITITDITVLGPNVDVTVRNDGETKIVEFDRMDLVIQYTSGTMLGGFTNHIRWLPYTTDSPQPDNTWTVLSVADDVIDPGVLNAGESMNLRVRLAPAVGTPTSNWLQVTTELGISASMFFTN